MKSGSNKLSRIILDERNEQNILIFHSHSYTKILNKIVSDDLYIAKPHETFRATTEMGLDTIL